MSMYKFSKSEINGIVSHIAAFDATILSMTPDTDFYVIELDITIDQDQYVHLQEEYGLMEVV